MGIVYEAEQKNPYRKVALKIVRGGHFVDDQYLRMFRRETEMLALGPRSPRQYEADCEGEPDSAALHVAIEGATFIPRDRSLRQGGRTPYLRRLRIASSARSRSSLIR